MKALLIIAQHGFQDHEYSETKAVLEKNNIHCITASIERRTADGKFGALIMPEISVKEAKVQDYDVIVLIGGPGAPVLADHLEVISFLKLARLKGKNLAAICIAPIILAKAGLLENKKATVFPDPEAIEFLKKSKAIYIDSDVVVDKQLVTANGPKAAKEFAEKIVAMLL